MGAVPYPGRPSPLLVLGCVFLASAALSHAQPGIIPLKDVKAGQKAIGRTVFQGGKVEEFQIEILGVLENIGPRQSLILGRLSGGPLAETGVMQGMSGSPVYIDGKLAGAVALAFPFSKAAIAGIRPIEEMFAATVPEPAVRAAVHSPFDTHWMDRLPRPAPIDAGGSRLLEVSTPLALSGFTRGTLEHFSPQLESLGLSPRQGQSGGGLGPRGPLGPASNLQPGSMISVQLMSGDMSVGADGTVTHIDGNRIWAFGHRFLAAGSTEMPFARAEVIALLPSVNNSFKISAPKEWMGVITEDRNTTVGGELGRRPVRLVPVTIEAGRQTYRMEMCGDRILAPMLLQMAVFSAIDARERALGPETVRVTGKVEFAGQRPVVINSAYSGDFAIALQTAINTVTPLAYAMSAAPDLKLERVTLRLDAAPAAAKVQIDQLWTVPKTARPGQEVEIFASLSTDAAAPRILSGKFRVPDHLSPGPLVVTASDGATANVQEYLVSSATIRTAAQAVAYLNSLRSAATVSIRVTRTDPAFPTPGGELLDPPPSVALLLAKSPGLTGTARPSLIAELRLDAGQPVSNSKTIQLDVKE